MQRVIGRRTVPVAPARLREAMTDVGSFMRAAGFDAVTVDGEHATIANHVGLLAIELDLRVVDDPDAVLAYEQVDSIFQSVERRYTIEVGPDETTVAAETTFALDAFFAGPLLDATVIRRQRRTELTAQFDYLESLAECFTTQYVPPPPGRR